MKPLVGTPCLLPGPGRQGGPRQDLVSAGGLSPAQLPSGTTSLCQDMQRKGRVCTPPGPHGTEHLPHSSWLQAGHAWWLQVWYVGGFSWSSHSDEEQTTGLPCVPPPQVVVHGPQGPVR